MMRKKTAVLFLLMALLLNGCGVQQNSVSAVAPAAKEETMQIAQEEMEQPLEQPVQQIEVTELREESEVRAGSSEDTLATPSDFPAAYNYGSGIQSEWDPGAVPVGGRERPGTDRIYRKHDRLL